MTKKEKNNYIKLYNKWDSANNLIIVSLLPYKDKEKREIERKKIESIKEFKNFDKDNIKSDYNKTMKSIKRFLVKKGIMKKSNIEGYCYKELKPKKTTRYEYIYHNIRYSFDD